MGDSLVEAVAEALRAHPAWETRRVGDPGALTGVCEHAFCVGCGEDWGEGPWSAIGQGDRDGLARLHEHQAPFGVAAMFAYLARPEIERRMVFAAKMTPYGGNDHYAQVVRAALAVLRDSCG